MVRWEPDEARRKLQDAGRESHDLEEGIARYTPGRSHVLGFRMGLDPGVGCRAYAVSTLWLLETQEQALVRLHEALALLQAGPLKDSML